MLGYNFTENVRRTLAKSRDEAARLHHEYVGTEHILLALTRDEHSVAASVLKSLSADLIALRQVIHETVKAGEPGRAVDENLPYTSRAKKVLELAMAEARDIGHEYVGTEHLLLGLLREEKGIGAQVLSHAGITLNAARAEVLRQLGAPDRAPRPSRARFSTGLVSPRIAPNWAFRLFWTTLGLVVFIESVQSILRAVFDSADANRHVAWLASVEGGGAVLFLFPRTMRYGAWILLAVFAVAMVVHLVRGEFPAPLLVYASGTLLVLIRGEH